MKKQLRKSEIKDINDKIEGLYGVKNFFGLKDQVYGGNKYVSKDGVLFFYDGNDLVPTIRALLLNNFLPKIVVDMGAVRFVTKGADVMRPGIVDFDNSLQGDIVVVVDENNKKPLAVGRMIFSSEESEKMDSGKVVKILHYVGDSIWEM